MVGMFGRFRSKAQKRSATVNRSGGFLAWLRGDDTYDTPVKVTPETALECVPFWACVRQLSTSVASLPIHVYDRDRATGAKTRVGNRTAETLGRAWNPELTAYQGWRWVIQQSALHGAAYVLIQRDGINQIANLWPLETKQVEVGRLNGLKYFLYHSTDGYHPGIANIGRHGANLDPRDVLEFPFFEDDDLLHPISPVEKCRGAIALWLGIERYQNSFFRDGGLPPIGMKYTYQSDEASARMRADLNRMVKDVQAKKGFIMNFPEDAEIIDPKMISPQAAQMVEAKRSATEEITRILGVPPILINDLSKGTYSNSEQQNAQYARHTLAKLANQIESMLNLKAFGRDMPDRFVEFDLKGEERGSFRDRTEGYARMIQSGIMTPNEVRATENLPPSDDENADKLHIQSGTVPIDSAGEEPEIDQEPPGLPEPEDQPEGNDDE